jgi:hypothetical protein
MAFSHNSIYCCQVPGHENVSFPTAEALAAHLDNDHSRLLPVGQTANLAARCKYAGSTPLLPLLREWNKGHSDRNNFIACIFCDRKISNFPEISLSETTHINLDMLSSSPEKYDVISGLVVNHLAQHLEEMALMCLRACDQARISEWNWAPTQQRYYRWRQNKHGEVQYQWKFSDESRADATM